MKIRSVFLLVGMFLLVVASTKATVVSYWHLDEASGNFNDSVGSNDLIDCGSTLNTLSPPTVPGYANLGSQTSLRAKTGYIPAVNLSTSAWTVEGFYRSSSTARQFVLSNNPGGSIRSGAWDIEASWKVVGALTFRIQAKDGTSIIMNGSRTVSDGAFHHFALTWSPTAGANGTVSMYVDGLLDISASGAGDQGAAVASLFYTGGLLLADGTFNSTLGVNGEMDELRISNTVLSPSQFLNVPEPATLALLFFGGLICKIRKQRC